MVELNLLEILSKPTMESSNETITIGFTGKLDSSEPDTLSFVSARNFVAEALINDNITHVITTKEISSDFRKNKNKRIIVSKNPKYDFYKIHNYLVKNKRFKKSNIHESVVLGENAYISSTGVNIGRGTRIGPNSTILKGVDIGANCNIGPGTVLGNDSFECIRFQSEVLTVLHDGEVVIGNNVDLGSNVTIDKGLMKKNTIIHDYVKIDNQVHISHNVEIKERSLLTAGVVVAGNSLIGSDVWIGPGAIISNRIILGNQAKISIGSVVVSDVSHGETVTGNFAINHRSFMKNHMKSVLKK